MVSGLESRVSSLRFQVSGVSVSGVSGVSQGYQGVSSIRGSKGVSSLRGSQGVSSLRSEVSGFLWYLRAFGISRFLSLQISVIEISIF